MLRVRKFGWCSLAVAMVWVGVPVGVSGQTLFSNPQLDYLHDAAVSLAFGPDTEGLAKAAWAHAGVAHLRQVYDERRFECLRTQADLLHAIGEVDGSRFYLEEAAAQAITEGRVYEAAMTYIDASLAAREAGNENATRQLAKRAWALSSSSSLVPLEREMIVGRILGAPTSTP